MNSTVTCNVCGNTTEVSVEPTPNPPAGWRFLGKNKTNLIDWGKPVWTCGCIPEGWSLHGSGEWIKRGLGRVSPMSKGRWLTMAGIENSLLAAILLCEDKQEEIKTFRGVL